MARGRSALARQTAHAPQPTLGVSSARTWLCHVNNRAVIVEPIARSLLHHVLVQEKYPCCDMLLDVGLQGGIVDRVRGNETATIKPVAASHDEPLFPLASKAPYFIRRPHEADSR